MGLFSGLTGHASEITPEEIQSEVGMMLASDEMVEKAFRVMRDLFAFTNKRLIMVNKQGMTGRKIIYESVPYRFISHYSIETAGHFDLDSELKMFIVGQAEPIYWEFKSGSNLTELQKTLASYI